MRSPSARPARADGKVADAAIARARVGQLMAYSLTLTILSATVLFFISANPIAGGVWSASPSSCSPLFTQLLLTAGKVTVVLAYLRRRPWLVPALTIMGIGVFGVASDRPWYLLFWASALAAVAGLLMVVAGYLGLRREGAEDRED